jgi:DNA-binding NarL/FixJ family response regulator
LQIASTLKAVKSAPNKNFTPKELKIIKLICQEYSNKEIGEKLELSGRTIEGYRRIILRKMKAKTAAGIALYAVRTGMIKA